MVVSSRERVRILQLQRDRDLLPCDDWDPGDSGLLTESTSDPLDTTDHGLLDPPRRSSPFAADD
jgi:hypothetical protein